jgi:hypothetical protein
MLCAPAFGSGEPDMAGYRLYFLEDKGHIQKAMELECADDDEAIKTSERYRQGVDLELWQLARVVTKLPKKGA